MNKISIKALILGYDDEHLEDCLRLIPFEKAVVKESFKNISEAELRNREIAKIEKEGFDYVLIVDADEHWAKDAIIGILEAVIKKPADAYKSRMKVFFKHKNWQINEDPVTNAIVCIKSSKRFDLNHPRNFSDGHIEQLNLPIYHFSYVRKDIKNKIKNFSHSHEIIDGWIEKFNNADINSTNLHPVNPSVFRGLTEVQLPYDISGDTSIYQ